MANMKDKAHDRIDTAASQAKDTASSFVNQAKDAAHNVADKATSASHGIVDTARDVASNVADKARDIASGVRDRVGSAAEAAGDRADSAAGWVGSNMSDLGSSIRSHAPGGFIGDAADRVASGLESSGRYLQEEGLTGMAKDVGDIIKRNPIPAMLVGIGIGFLLARATTSSRS